MADPALLRLHPGKFINKIEVEDMATVKVGRAPLGAQVGVLLRRGKVIAGIGQIMRPGVVRIDLRAAAKVLLQAGLQRVVVRLKNWRRNVDGSVSLERTNYIRHTSVVRSSNGTDGCNGTAYPCESNHRRVEIRTCEWLVDVHNPNQVSARAAVIADIEDEPHGQLFLHIQTPHLLVRQDPASA